MALLTQQDIAKYALAIGKVFAYVCDEEGCGKLIAPGELFIVLKWTKRKDGITFMGAIPTKIRCMTCHRDMNPEKEKEVAVRGAGRGAKKVTKEEASTLTVNPLVRRAAISLLKRLETLSVADMLLKLRKKKAIRELKKSEIVRTLRTLKKLKVLRCRAKVWTIVPQKLKKTGKIKKNKLKKVLAKR